MEYAKEGAEVVLIRITVHNRGPEESHLRLLPQIRYRNTWSCCDATQKPFLRAVAPGMIQASHPDLGDYWLHCDGSPELLVTDNETNTHRLWGQTNGSAFVKDAFHSYVVAGERGAV